MHFTLCDTKYRVSASWYTSREEVLYGDLWQGMMGSTVALDQGVTRGQQKKGGMNSKARWT